MRKFGHIYRTSAVQVCPKQKTVLLFFLLLLVFHWSWSNLLTGSDFGVTTNVIVFMKHATKFIDQFYFP